MLAAFMEKQAPKPAKGRESDALYLQQGTKTQTHTRHRPHTRCVSNETGYALEWRWVCIPQLEHSAHSHSAHGTHKALSHTNMHSHQGTQPQAHSSWPQAQCNRKCHWKRTRCRVPSSSATAPSCGA